MDDKDKTTTETTANGAYIIHHRSKITLNDRNDAISGAYSIIYENLMNKNISERNKNKEKVKENENLS